MSAITSQLAPKAIRQVLGKTQLERVGSTPLVRLTRITGSLPRVQILGKGEWANPGGSVKDRPALNIVREAERNGQLGTGRTLLDATSGNTGIAYAMIGAARGFPVKRFVKPASWRPASRTSTFTPTSIRTMPIGVPTITRQPTKSGARLKDASRTSWRPWEPAARSSDARDACVN